MVLLNLNFYKQRTSIIELSDCNYMYITLFTSEYHYKPAVWILPIKAIAINTAKTTQWSRKAITIQCKCFVLNKWPSAPTTTSVSVHSNACLCDIIALNFPDNLKSRFFNLRFSCIDFILYCQEYIRVHIWFT